MSGPEVEALSRTLADARDLLRQFGDTETAIRLEDLQRRLNLGEPMAVVGAVSEATGGMGSLRDRYLCVANGDAIRSEEIEEVNARLDALVREMERSARAAAAVLDIKLVR